MKTLKYILLLGILVFGIACGEGEGPQGGLPCTADHCGVIDIDLYNNTDLDVNVSMINCSFLDGDFIKKPNTIGTEFEVIKEDCLGDTDEIYLRTQGVDQNKSDVISRRVSNIYYHFIEGSFDSFRYNIYISDGNVTKRYSYIGWDQDYFPVESNASKYTILGYGLGGLTSEGRKTKFDENLSGQGAISFDINVNSMDDINISITR